MTFRRCRDIDVGTTKRLLNTLYIWIATHHSLSVFTCADFLNLFFVRSYSGYSCIFPVYYGSAPLRFINELTLLIVVRVI